MPRKKLASGPLKFDITPDELEIFLEGVNDCLDTMESGILHLEQQRDADTLNEVFRAAHTPRFDLRGRKGEAGRAVIGAA